MYLIFSGNNRCEVMGGMEHAEVVHTCILEPNCWITQDSKQTDTKIIIKKELQT